MTLLLGHRFYVIPNATARIASPPPQSCCSPGDSPGAAGKPKVNRFDSSAAWRLLGWQVDLGQAVRSAASRRLARRFRRLLPRSRYQPVAISLRNVVGRVPGRNRQLRGRGRPLRHQGHPRLRGGERRRLRNRGRHPARPHDQAAPPAQDGRLHVLFDGEESPAGSRRGVRGRRPARQQGGGAPLPPGECDGAARLRGREGPPHPPRGVLEPSPLAQASPRGPSRRGGPTFPAGVRAECWTTIPFGARTCRRSTSSTSTSTAGTKPATTSMSSRRS